MSVAEDAYLELRFDDLAGETKPLRDQVSHFFESSQPLDALLDALRILKHKQGGGPYRWEIPLTNPLRTKETDAYRTGSGHRQSVVGEISTLWSITPLGRRVRKSPILRVENASTLVRVFELSDDQERELVAEWRMEVAAGDPPGCFFHAQIGEPVPDWLEVPRLPFVVPTPATSVEFVLGELFQKEWREFMSSRASAPNMAQRGLLLGWLKWQEKAVMSGGGSSWLALKKAAPGPDDFV